MSQIEHDGKFYDSETGSRLTNCCKAFSTFHDNVLCCRACYQEVELGEGDGSEILPDEKNPEAELEIQ